MMSTPRGVSTFLLAGFCALSLLLASSSADQVLFVYYHNPHVYTVNTNRPYSVQISYPIPGFYHQTWMSSCNNDWWTHIISAPAQSADIQFPVYAPGGDVAFTDTPACNLGSSYMTSYNGGYFMVSTDGTCGGTIDPNFVPRPSNVGCDTNFQGVYYYNTAWAGAAVNLQLSNGGNIPMSYCQDGYYYLEVATLAAADSYPTIYFQNQVTNDIDYADCSNSTGYVAAFGKTYMLISSTGCNGTIESYVPNLVCGSNPVPTTTTSTTITTITDTETVTDTVTSTSISTSTATATETATVTVTATPGSSDSSSAGRVVPSVLALLFAELLLF